MRLCPLSAASALFFFALFHAGAAAATEPLYRKFNVSLGYDYSTGRYGTAHSTDIAYVPLTVTAEVGWWSLQGTIPYLRITGPGGSAQGPNGPIPTSGNADGLGDMLVRGSYTLPSETMWIPFIELFGRVKFPTADRNEGLGTGRFDFGAETEFSWALRRFTPFVDLGYRFLGSSPSFPLHDVFLASVGGLYRVLDPLNAGLFLDYRQAASAATGQRLELVPYASWKLDARWSVDVYASAGLASGSPDAGFGLQIAYTLPSFAAASEQ